MAKKKSKKAGKKTKASSKKKSLKRAKKAAKKSARKLRKQLKKAAKKNTVKAKKKKAAKKAAPKKKVAIKKPAAKKPNPSKVQMKPAPMAESVYPQHEIPPPPAMEEDMQEMPEPIQDVSGEQHEEEQHEEEEEEPPRKRPRKIITAPVASLPVPEVNRKFQRSPVKEKLRLEFEVRSSPRILFNYLSTPTGLSEWFADNVTLRDGVYIFKWADNESRAQMVHKKDNHSVRFDWIDEEEALFVEMEIVTDDLTGEVALVITDFADSDQKEEIILLWESQVQTLRGILGSLN